TASVTSAPITTSTAAAGYSRLDKIAMINSFYESGSKLSLFAGRNEVNAEWDSLFGGKLNGKVDFVDSVSVTEKMSGPNTRGYSPIRNYNFHLSNTLELAQRFYSEADIGKNAKIFKNGSGVKINGFTTVRPNGEYVQYRDGKWVGIGSEQGKSFAEQMSTQLDVVESAYARVPKESQIDPMTALTIASMGFGIGEGILVARGSYALARVLGNAGLFTSGAQIFHNIFNDKDFEADTAVILTLNTASDAADDIAKVGGNKWLWIGTAATGVIWDGKDGLQYIGPATPHVQNPVLNNPALDQWYQKNFSPDVLNWSKPAVRKP
ncbi:MAG TPA: hypothetical protein VN226_05465, partial [Anaerolineales bacterium]|nr:hypothetical protein [Anaerolineales bacterium]